MDTTRHRQWWEAVLSRDGSYDGVFVYGVRSTGIYCRPSCGARKPREDGVEFFGSAGQAGAAGFRPCRRCRPDDAGNGDERVEAMRRLARFIEEYDSPDRPLTLSIMSDYLGLSPSYLQRTFTRVVGVSPRRYAEINRIGRLKSDMKKGSKVTSALYGAGYGSSSRLYETAAARLGMTPGTYGKGGKGMTIRYGIVGCRMGRLLVAATDRGVSAVSIGDSDEVLERALFDEYPSAAITRDRAGLEGYIDALLTYLDGGRKAPRLPLDVRISAFQARVYAALAAIPYGSVSTYRQVAEMIGRPAAARAVGTACTKNATALIVPCHRVVRTDGDPGGYRWGTERKEMLIAMEHEREEGKTVTLFEHGAGI
jgi:AraC family transcriptional regulator of adaptative response/methylated-DNA-[protein]-cysteine methyltransferase